MDTNSGWRRVLHSAEMKTYTKEWLAASCTTRDCPFHSTLMDLGAEAAARAIDVMSSQEVGHGDQVQLYGLVARPDLNGRVGIAVGGVLSTGRRKVRLGRAVEDVLSVKPTNLEVMRAPTAVELFTRALSFCPWQYAPKADWYFGRAEIYQDQHHHLLACLDAEAALAVLASQAASTQHLDSARMQRAVLLCARSQIALGQRPQAIARVCRLLERENDMGRLDEARAWLAAAGVAASKDPVSVDEHTLTMGLQVQAMRLRKASPEPEASATDCDTQGDGSFDFEHITTATHALEEGQRLSAACSFEQAIGAYARGVELCSESALQLQLLECRTEARVELIAHTKWLSAEHWMAARLHMHSAMADLITFEDVKVATHSSVQDGLAKVTASHAITEARACLHAGLYRSAFTSFQEAAAAIQRLPEPQRRYVRAEVSHAEALCRVLPLRLSSLDLSATECITRLESTPLPANSTLLLHKIHEHLWMHFCSGSGSVYAAADDESAPWDELTQRMRALALAVDLTALHARPGSGALLFETPLQGLHHLYSEPALTAPGGVTLDSSRFKDMTPYIFGMFVCTVLARMTREAPEFTLRRRAVQRLISLDCDYRVRDSMGSSLTTCITMASGVADFGYARDAELRELFVLEGGLRCVAIELRDDTCMRDFCVDFLLDTPLATWREQPSRVLEAVLEFAVAPCMQDELEYDISNPKLLTLVVANHRRKVGQVLESLVQLGDDLICCVRTSEEPFLCFLREELRKHVARGALVPCKKLLKAWEKMPHSKCARASTPTSHSLPDTAPKTQAARNELPGKQRFVIPIVKPTSTKETKRPAGIVGECCAVCLVLAPQGKQFATCGGCGSFAYCCKQHAKEHWKNGHKEECALLQQKHVAEEQRKCFMGM